MKNRTSNFFIFTLGVIVGSLITWKYAQKKYEKIAEDEISSVKEVFSKKEVSAQEKANQAKEKPDIADYAKYTSELHKNGYTNYSDIYNNNNEKEKNNFMGNPYVIAPEDFGEFEEYEKISLTYYSDNILADDTDDLVEDVENTVGVDSLTRFGEYEDDSVFVRNDRLKCDYEILLDRRTHKSLLHY